MEAFGRYRVIRELGKGGMGSVLLCEQTDLGRTVAVKVLEDDLAHDPNIIERLRREARAAGSLSHPNIAQIYALEEIDGRLLLVMEHVDGPSLRSILSEGIVPLPRAIGIARQILAGLAVAHAAGIVHRDVKPENILVTKDERDRDLVKLVDFGIAKAQNESALTERGTVIGTPSYLAPEQVRGEEATPRSDVWSVGVVLYEMLGGERPFHSRDIRELLKAIATSSPALLSETIKAPEWISALVDRALRKDPEARFTAKEMYEALREPEESAAATARPKRKEEPETARPERKEPQKETIREIEQAKTEAAPKKNSSNTTFAIVLALAAALVAGLVYFFDSEPPPKPIAVLDAAAVIDVAPIETSVPVVLPVVEAAPLPRFSIADDSGAELGPLGDPSNVMMLKQQCKRLPEILTITVQTDGHVLVIPDDEDQCRTKALSNVMMVIADGSARTFAVKIE